MSGLGPDAAAASAHHVQDVGKILLQAQNDLRHIRETLGGVGSDDPKGALQQVVEKVEVRWPALIHSELWRPPSAGTAVRSRPGSVGWCTSSNSSLESEYSPGPKASTNATCALYVAPLERPVMTGPPPGARASQTRSRTRGSRSAAVSSS